MADVISLVCAILGAVAWIIALGGLAAVTSLNLGQSVTALSWWTLWFQFFLIIFSLLLSVGGLKCARLRTDMYLMVSVLWMITAWDSNKVLDNNNTKGKLESGTAAYMAGAVITLVVNMLQFIYWGVTENGTEPLQLGRKTEADAAATAPGAGPSPVVTVEPAKPAVTV